MRAHLNAGPCALATSRMAVVEVGRAVAVAHPGDSGRANVEALLASCLLVDVSAELLRAASRLTSREVRTLDAIHLASAHRVTPDEVLVYDARLAAAAERNGFSVVAPR